MTTPSAPDLAAYRAEHAFAVANNRDGLIVSTADLGYFLDRIEALERIAAAARKAHRIVCTAATFTERLTDSPLSLQSQMNDGLPTMKEVRAEMAEALKALDRLAPKAPQQQGDDQ